MSDKVPLLNLEKAQTYLQQAHSKVSDMEASFLKRNFTGISALARQLKSSSANLDAMNLSGIFARIEEAAKLKDVENLLRLFPEMKKTFSEFRAELEKLASGSVKKAS